MEVIKSIILGIVQGVTEFLPISSSGHLILFRDILGLQVNYGLAFDAVLQLATTLAILVYFRKEIIDLVKSFFKIILRREQDQKQKNITLAVIIGTIPAIILGILLEEFMDTVFRNSLLVAGTLVFGSLIMYFAEKFAAQNTEINWKNGLIIGLFQSLALVPGMSRSGMTISGGLFMGLPREIATRFSFILAFPILFASGIKKLIDLGSGGFLNVIGVELLWGSIASFLTGILAIHFLIKYLRANNMNVFIWYRVLLAIGILIFVL
jgi:undecaprenyl-diphosphatase